LRLKHKGWARSTHRSHVSGRRVFRVKNLKDRLAGDATKLERKFCRSGGKAMKFQGSCPVCTLGEIESNDKPVCSKCGREFCTKCGGVRNGAVSTKVLSCSCTK